MVEESRNHSRSEDQNVQFVISAEGVPRGARGRDGGRWGEMTGNDWKWLKGDQQYHRVYETCLNGQRVAIV